MGIIGCDANPVERHNPRMDETFSTVRFNSSSKLMYEFTKRSFDVAAGAVLLTLFSPCLLFAAVAVRCTSRGPVIYKQIRVGRYGRPFWVWKFRTMTDDADQCGPLITAADDVRVTRVGRFLRGCKVDELPQLWNVVIGEMSLVGPRPQVPRFVEAFPADQRAIILTVRPGITGPTQLKFREEENMLRGLENREEYYIQNLLPIKCRMDVDYVMQRCFRLDMTVLCKTGYAVLLSLLRRMLGRASTAQIAAHVEASADGFTHREHATRHEEPAPEYREDYQAGYQKKYQNDYQEEGDKTPA